MNMEQLKKVLQEEAYKAHLQRNRYEGIVRMYMDALLRHDDEQAETHRRELHDLLDLMLDSQAIMCRAHAQMMRDG